MADFLHDDRVGARAELGKQPVAGLPVTGLVRNARPERHLLLDVGERRTPVEFHGPRSRITAGASLAAGEKQDEEVLPPQPPQPPPSSTNAVPNTLTDEEKAAGWRLLFDGQSTAGWRNYGKQTIAAGWRIEDGALTRTGAGGDIITTDQFGNFDLSLEWKIEPGGNSGIFYRAVEDKDEIYWNAPEVQVLDDANHPDGRSRLQSAGALYDLYEVPPGIVKPANEWNTVRLIATGPHVEHWLNGVKVVDYEIGSRDWDS
ncbi:MAG: 3-keto-disaccharide hydrolase, partial [Burkholderiales bacterium]